MTNDGRNALDVHFPRHDSQIVVAQRLDDAIENLERLDDDLTIESEREAIKDIREGILLLRMYPLLRPGWEGASTQQQCGTCDADLSCEHCDNWDCDCDNDCACGTATLCPDCDMDKILQVARDARDDEEQRRSER